MKYDKCVLFYKIIFYCIELMFGFSFQLWGENSNKVYVSNKYRGDIYVLDTNLEIIEHLEKNVMGTILTSSKEYIYAIGLGGISVISKRDFVIEKEIEFWGNPTPGMGKAVITPDSKTMYIGIIGWGKPQVVTSGIYVIDLVQAQVREVLAKNNISSGMIDISKDGKYLYYPEVNTLHIVELPQLKLIKTIVLEDEIKEVEEQGEIIKYKIEKDIEQIKAGANQELFVAVNIKPNIPEKYQMSQIIKINLETNDQKEIELSDKILKLGLYQNNKLYIICLNSLLIMDTVKDSIAYSLSVLCDNLAVSHNGKSVYLISESINQLMIFDVEKAEIIKTILLGNKPYEIECD